MSDTDLQNFILGLNMMQTYPAALSTKKKLKFEKVEMFRFPTQMIPKVVERTAQLNLHEEKCEPFTTSQFEANGDKILQGIVCILNGLQGEKIKPQSTNFVGPDLPDMAIPQYCERLAKYFRCCPTVYVCAFIYLDRIVSRSEVTVNPYTIHRLLITSFVVAAKYWEDSHYTNDYYAQVGGVDTADLNRLEWHMLGVLKFDLHVEEAEFESFSVELQNHPTVCETFNSKPEFFSPSQVLPGAHVLPTKTAAFQTPAVEQSTQPSTRAIEPHRKRKTM